MKLETLRYAIRDLSQAGVNMASLGRELECRHEQWLNSIKYRNANLSADAPRLALRLNYIAKVAESYDPERYSLKYVCERLAIKESRLARMLGISRQALHQWHLRGVPRGRQPQVARTIRDYGKRIRTVRKTLTEGL